MDHSRRASGTAFSDDVNEFDLLLEEDDGPVAAGAPASRTGRMPVARRAAVDPDEPVAAGRARIRITPDWNRVAAVLLIAAVALFLLYFLVTTIMSSRRESSYKDYVSATREIAKESTAQGEELAGILTSPTKGTTAQRIAEIEGVSGRADQLARRAEQLEAPEQLAAAQDSFALSLRYRANGVQAVQRALGASIETKDEAAAAEAVSAALSRLVASDVVWADSFAVEARSTLREDDITGATVPDSVFATDTDLYGPKAVASMLERFQASGTATTTKDAATAAVPDDGKIRGGEVGAPTIAPSGQTLASGAVTEIKGGEDIVFEVPFTNQGEVQLTEVPVKITLTGEESEAITLTGVIDVVEPGQTASASISLDEPPNYGVTLDYDILVGPIPGEKTADNNRTTGQVRFSL